MRYLKTNTATIVTVGPFYDKTDGVTIETALTITNERISFTVDANDGSAPTLVLDNVTGATSGTSNDLNYITNCDAGLMQLELSAANTNYLGRAFLTITDAANHCPVFHEFTILPALVYDSIIAGTDNLQVDTIQVTGTAQTARDIGASVLLSSGTGTGQVTLTSGRVNADLTHIATAAVSTTTAQLGVNVVQISTDATAADNAEAFFDGTGYAGTNNVIPTVTTATNVTNVNGLANNVITAASINTGAITNAKFAAGAIDAAAIAAGAIDAATFAADVDAEILSYLVDDATRIDASALNTATGTSIPAILSDTGTDGVVVAAASKTGYTLTATTGLGNQTADITGNLSGSVGSVTGAVGSVAGNVAGSIGSLATQAKADVNAEVVDVLRTDTLPDDYAAHEAQPTFAEAILAIHQFLMEREVSGTSVTVQKPDGTTTAMTLTINSATDPTTIHRSA